MPDFKEERTQVFSEIHVHDNNTAEHVVKEFIGLRGVNIISCDLTEITKDLQIKIQEKTDGTNYRIKAFKTFDQARFEIDAVADNGGKAQYQTTSPHGLSIDDTVITRNFTTITSYNTIDTVSVILDTTHFELTNVNFDTSTDTGYVVTPSTANDYRFGTQTIVAVLQGTGNDIKLTFQSPVAEGANRNVPLTIRETIPIEDSGSGTNIINKKCTLLGSDTHAAILSGAVAGVDPVNQLLYTTPIGSGGSTVFDNVETIFTSRILVATSPINKGFWRITQGIDFNNPGFKPQTIRIREDDVNGTILATVVITTSPNTIIITANLTNQPVGNKTYVGTIQNTLNDPPNDFYRLHTEATSVIYIVDINDTHAAALGGSNTQRTTNESIL